MIKVDFHLVPPPRLALELHGRTTIDHSTARYEYI